MENTAELEKKLLGLPIAERERVIVGVWESLVSDSTAISNEKIDAEGISLAKERDSEINAGSSHTVSQDEFRRLTDSND